MISQIPFFCGSHPNCWEPGSEWALARAKAVLAEHYLLVGQTEDLASMYTVLELVGTDADTFLPSLIQIHRSHDMQKDLFKLRFLEVFYHFD